MPIIAVIETIDAAMAAVAELERAGIPREAITVMSGKPIHSLSRDDSDDRGSSPGLYAVAGGLAGAGVALLLTIWTSRRINVMTGGMPIVTPWAFGIIVFELTALGAILATLVRLILGARLLRRGALNDYDEAVGDGKTVVSVICEDDAGRDGAKKVLMMNSTCVREADPDGTNPGKAHPGPEAAN